MINNSNIAIRLSNVSKKYTVHHEKPTFMESVLNGKNEEFWALKKINLEIKKGERVGLIGPNGCGKTTLLKVIAGISTPTSGSVEISGKVVSLIDLEAGFHPDLTGIQNIYLSGMLLGMKKTEIDKTLPKVIKFADIGKFIDAQLFTYSSGMMLRLGFSVAIYSDPEILILDENISVGDQDFLIKTSAKIHEFLKLKKTLVFASHNAHFISDYCDKVVWLESGRILKAGKTKNIMREYTSKV